MKRKVTQETRDKRASTIKKFFLKHPEEKERRIIQLKRIIALRKGKDYNQIYGEKKAKQIKDKMSKAKIENTWNWKGGISQNYYKWLIRRLGLKTHCSVCNSKNHLVVHHINKNRKDNKLQNLQIVCLSCHSKIHNLIRFVRKDYVPKELICVQQ